MRGWSSRPTRNTVSRFDQTYPTKNLAHNFQSVNWSRNATAQDTPMLNENILNTLHASTSSGTFFDQADPVLSVLSAQRLDVANPPHSHLYRSMENPQILSLSVSILCSSNDIWSHPHLLFQADPRLSRSNDHPYNVPREHFFITAFSAKLYTWAIGSRYPDECRAKGWRDGAEHVSFFHHPPMY